MYLRSASRIALGLRPRAIRLAERRYQAVSLFYKGDNDFIISFFLFFFNSFIFFLKIQIKKKKILSILYFFFLIFLFYFKKFF